MHNQSSISVSRDFKASVSLFQFNYWVLDAIRILSTLRSNFEMCPSRGDQGVQPTAIQDCTMGPDLSSICGARWLTYVCKPVVFCVGTHSTSPQLLSKIYGPLPIVLLYVSPEYNLSQMEPSKPPLVGIAEAEKKEERAYNHSLGLNK